MKKFNVLFVHDHIFLNCDRAFFSEGKITDKVFSRYDVCASSIRVLSRCNNVLTPTRLVEITHPSVTFVPVRGISFFKVFTVNFFYNFMLVVKEFRRADFAIIRLPSFLGVFAAAFFVFLKKPFFLEMVGHAGEAVSNSRGSNLFVLVFSRIFDAMVKAISLRANGVIYVTKSYLQSYYPNFNIVEYASNVEIDLGSAPRLRVRYSTNRENLVIGLIGSFKNNYKGIDAAIRAISILKERGVNCELRVLGSGNENRYLELARSLNIEDRVFFDGVRKSGSEIFEWLDGLDVYIQPSLTEGLPRSLIEAMSRALPCVASSVGGIPELLQDDWLFAAGDYEALAERIYSFANDEALRERMGNRNYLASKEYDLRELGARRLSFWNRVREYMASL